MLCRSHRLIKTANVSATRGLATIEKMNGGSQKKEVTASESKKNQVIKVTGFSQFSRRCDLEKVLDIPSLIVHDAMRELDRTTLYPTNAFVIETSLAVDHNTNFNSAFDLVKNHIMNKYNRRFQVMEVFPQSLKNIVTDKSYDIDSCTLRLRNVPFVIGTEELKFLFRNFDMARDRPWERLSLKGNHHASKHHGGTSYNWFVRFATPAEAERAFTTLEGKNLSGRPVQMFLYA
jgi:hypothetical protein